MPHALLIFVRFHDGRYHGTGPWPPAPARLFQALVAGAAEGGTIPPTEHKALMWLEALPPPEIAAPPTRAGEDYINFVPNNDLDAKGGDPDAIIKDGKKKGPAISFIRAPKQIRPRLFDPREPLLYLWRFEGGEAEARTLVSIAERLYQLGRGVDMAWAVGNILEADEAEAHLLAHSGAIYRPSENGRGPALACPVDGSLESLIDRHKAMGGRLQMRKAGSGTQQLFSQPPKPRFMQVPYDSPPECLLFGLRDLSRKAGFHAWPLSEVVRLVETVRDKAAARIRKAYEQAGRHDRTARVDRVFIGRNSAAADKPTRIRITPLPSIGHPHADSSIRRVLLQIPPDCPLPRGDVAWAFSGLHLGTDYESGEILDEGQPLLVATDDERMLRHYGIESEEPTRLWRTITPAALPERAARRRIDPGRVRRESKGGAERLAEEERAASAVRDALRHSGIRTPIESIRVQREPFQSKGVRAESFATGTRFSKCRLWHVEIAFSKPRAGPTVIGDGRYLGLGLMAPVRGVVRRVCAFAIDGISPPASAGPAVLTALRRALMAVDRDLHGEVSTLFSGHALNGGPAAGGQHRHVFLAATRDEGGHALACLYVIRPDAVDRTVRLSRAEKEGFERVVSELQLLRAGSHGVLGLRPLGLQGESHVLFRRSRRWISATDYAPTRHPRPGSDPANFVEGDCAEEIRRRGLPVPRRVRVQKLETGPRGGLRARLALEFAVAVQGPLLLGRRAHMGEGAFVPDN